MRSHEGSRDIPAWSAGADADNLSGRSGPFFRDLQPAEDGRGGPARGMGAGQLLVVEEERAAWPSLSDGAAARETGAGDPWGGPGLGRGSAPQFTHIRAACGRGTEWRKRRDVVDSQRIRSRVSGSK